MTPVCLKMDIAFPHLVQHKPPSFATGQDSGLKLPISLNLDPNQSNDSPDFTFPPETGTTRLYTAGLFSVLAEDSF